MTVAPCIHGFPSPASCIDCMEDGPVMAPRPDQTQKLHAHRWIKARYEGSCARRLCSVAIGDDLGDVDDIGWCCGECAE